MSAFSFTKQKVRLTHINTREEKHGDDNVLVVDLTIKADVSNDFLSELHSTLKWSLYDKPPEADLAQDAAHMPVLRYAFMAPIAWREELNNAAVVLHGSTKAKDLQFEADVNKLVLDCKDGGTVAIAFRIQTPVTPEQLGSLGALLSREFKVAVTPAVEEAMAPTEE